MRRPGWLQLSHLAGIAALLAMLPWASRFTPLALATACTVVLVVVALWESWWPFDSRSKATAL